jgi:hypothetical protein
MKSYMSALPSFTHLNHAFQKYLQSFPDTDERIRDHFEVKKTHTYRVIREIQLIAVKSGLSTDQTELAEILALFHDIGRFEQFTKYGTFNDDISENHATLSIRVLQEQNFLSGFDDKTIRILTLAIGHHNIPLLPKIMDPDVLLFSRLLRDADKLDIWRLTLHQNVAFTIRNEMESSYYKVPEMILRRICEGQVVLLGFAESMNDFRLLRLSWVFDVNFPVTFSVIEKRQYIDKILAKIPEFPEKKEISEILHDHCRKRMEQSFPPVS